VEERLIRQIPIESESVEISLTSYAGAWGTLAPTQALERIDGKAVRSTEGEAL
jgi:hypothetical protein